MPPPSTSTHPSAGDAPTCVETWAARYVTASALAYKTDPPPPPRAFAPPAVPHRVEAPGRPPELRLVGKTKRSLLPAQLATPRYRAQLLHTFWHHELQAAELMCWAIGAFPATPVRFRMGLLAICKDEIRHMRLYQREVERLGHRLGDFPVRDWFWHRVATCTTPVQFVALMGLGLEGGNLDHAARYTAAFTAAGDLDAARTQATVGREEIAHVRFAAKWFAHWTGGVDFARWAGALPPPLSPRLLRGAVIDRQARARAGLPAAFLDALAAT